VTSADLPAGRDAGRDEGPPALEIWHSRDEQILPAQRLGEVMRGLRSDLAAWHVDDGRVTVLGDESASDVRLLGGQRHAVARDPPPYARDAMFGPALFDLYLIDVRTGERRLIRPRLQHAHGGSPAGRYVLYLEGDDYWSYDVATGERRNLTATLP